jgi:hypothetical protein
MQRIGRFVRDCLAVEAEQAAVAEAEADDARREARSRSGEPHPRQRLGMARLYVATRDHAERCGWP